MGQIKHKMGSIGGGVNLSHKGPKMSGKAKSLESYPGGMPGPGNYGQMDNKVVGKGMAQYLAGESVGMKKYGQHKGPEKALVGKQENLPEGLKAKIEAAPGMYGKKEKAPMSGGPAMVRAPRKKKKEVKKSDLTIGKTTAGKTFGKAGGDLKFDKVDLVAKGNKSKSKSSESSSSSGSDMDKIKASKKIKIQAGKDKKAEGQSDLKKARETKFISRGSGEDSGVETRQGRRKKIRAARSKKREGRRAERKARKGTVIKQKNVRQRKADD